MESGVFSARELLLLAHFMDPQSPGYNNATVAAQLAGFQGKRTSLSVKGCKTVSKAKKYGLFEIILRRYGCTFDFIVLRLMACATARRKQVFVTKDGIVEHDLGDDCRVQLETLKFLSRLVGVAPTPTVLATQSGAGATGASGDHGNEFAEIAILYDLYLVSCLKDPTVTFGMRSGSNIAFVNVSVTINQAKKVLFEGLGTFLQRSPYFLEVFPYDKKLKTMLKFPKRVLAYPATASPEGVLGEGIFSAAIDEANFMQIVEGSRRSVPGDTGLYDQAERTFNKLESRIVSRMNTRGRVPGHILVISSARYPGDFTERLQEKARTPEGKHIFVRRYSSWGTRPKSVAFT